MSDSVRPHKRQPTRLPCPWDSPGKNTGMGCHFLLQCKKVKRESKVTQSCLTLSDPMDCSLPGSSVHGIFQARLLKWGAIAFSRLLMTVVNNIVVMKVCVVRCHCGFRYTGVSTEISETELQQGNAKPTIGHRLWWMTTQLPFFCSYAH